MYYPEYRPFLLNIYDNFESSIFVKYISIKELKRIVSSLYERLQLDMSEKFQFLSENPGHGPSTIAVLHKVLSSAEILAFFHSSSVVL